MHFLVGYLCTDFHQIWCTIRFADVIVVDCDSLYFTVDYGLHLLVVKKWQLV